MRVRCTCAVLLALLLAQNYLSAQEKVNSAQEKVKIDRKTRETGPGPRF